MFKDIKNMPARTTFCGWRFLPDGGAKFTGETASAEDCVKEIEAYVHKMGFARHVDTPLYVVRETTTLEPVSCVQFGVTRTTIPVKK